MLYQWPLMSHRLTHTPRIAPIHFILARVFIFLVCGALDNPRCIFFSWVTSTYVLIELSPIRLDVSCIRSYSLLPEVFTSQPQVMGYLDQSFFYLVLKYLKLDIGPHRPMQINIIPLTNFSLYMIFILLASIVLDNISCILYS